MTKYNTSPGLSRGLTWALHNNLWQISSLIRAHFLAVEWGDWIRCCLMSLPILAFYGSLNVFPTNVMSRFKKALNHLPSSLKVNRYLHPQDWRCFSNPHVPMKHLRSMLERRLRFSVLVVRQRQCISQIPTWCWCCWSSKCTLRSTPVVPYRPVRKLCVEVMREVKRARQLSTLQRRSLKEQPTCSLPPFVISVVPDAATATSCSETAGEFFQALFNSLALIW